MTPRAIDAAWRGTNPLPSIGGGQDKDARGQALVVGGSPLVPGALRLTGEAVLRVGAGKLKLALPSAAATAMGVAFPEAAVIALPEDATGEIAGHAATTLEHDIDACDVLVLGPGMMEQPQTADIVLALLQLGGSAAPVLLDAGALTAMCDHAEAVKRSARPVVMTPHHGELATLLAIDKDAVADDPAGAAIAAADRFGAVVAVKAAQTFIADASGTLLHYVSEAPGLGTAGSGDVLAGVIGGLLARGMTPLAAAGWGVYLHGEAGNAAASAIGSIGFLARDLLPHFPKLLDAAPK